MSLYDEFNAEGPWYCGTCMIAQSVTPIPATKDGQECIELFCPKGHLVTRLITGEGHRIDESASDGCPAHHDMPSGAAMFIPLKDSDIEAIRQGKFVDYHFHDRRFQRGRVTFLVGHRESIPQPTSKIAQAYLKSGDVQPIVLSDAEIQQLIKTDGSLCCRATNTDLQVCVITEKALKKVQAKKEVERA